jgi:methionyl-tRNA formyltransferase
VRDGCRVRGRRIPSQKPFASGTVIYDTIAAMTRIVFMGTPEFSVPVLEALTTQHDVVGVYTRADKPAGRGKQISESPVKIFAREHDLNLEQPRTLRNTGEQNRLREYDADLLVVAAYGLILPKAVLDAPKHGSINTHPSLLPRWRGASPIPFTILSGDTETGVTIMQMDEGLDTGPILSVRTLLLAQDETTGSLTEKLSKLCADLLLETIPAYLSGKIKPVPQDNAQATMTRLVAKEDGLINWKTSAVYLERMVRAYQPWPAAYTHFQGEMFKILRASVSPADVPELPGTVLQMGKDIGIATGKGVLLLHEVQLAGKRALSIEEFARGQREFVGSILA